MPAKPSPIVPGSTKALCPHCGKKVIRHGLVDHVRAAHPDAISTTFTTENSNARTPA